MLEELHYIPSPGSRQHITADKNELYVETDAFCQFFKQMGIDVTITFDDEIVHLIIE